MTKKNLLEFFQDINGDNSSKRLSGIFCISTGVIMKLSLFFYSFSHQLATPFEKLDACADTLLYVGMGLLGFGVAEFFAKRKKYKIKC